MCHLPDQMQTSYSPACVPTQQGPRTPSRKTWLIPCGFIRFTEQILSYPRALATEYIAPNLGKYLVRDSKSKEDSGKAEGRR